MGKTGILGGALSDGRFQLYCKIGILLLIVAGSLIPLGMVRGLVLERKALNQSVEQELSATWGQSQRIIGPILSVPFEEEGSIPTLDLEGVTKRTIGERTVTNRRRLYLMPEELDVASELTTTLRRRGIYETPLYTARSMLSGRFGAPDLEALDIGENAKLLWEEAQVEVFISDVSRSLNAITLSWGDSETAFRLDNDGNQHASRITAPLALTGSESSWLEPFAIQIDLNVSDSFAVAPLGKSTTMALSSSWPHPSFAGSTLPSRTDITADGFTANWELSHFVRGMPQQWRSDQSSVQDVLFEDGHKGLITRLIKPVDHYRKAERSVKYGVLFVALVSAVLFAFEVVAGRRVHVVQYGMIAAALCIFFVLLLSLSELLGFAAAYGLAAAMSVTLIAPYTAKVAESWRYGGLVTALLTAVYAYLYMTLQSEDHALVMGALLLFTGIAALMFATRNVDWYSVGRPLYRQEDSQVKTSGQA